MTEQPGGGLDPAIIKAWREAAENAARGYAADHPDATVTEIIAASVQAATDQIATQHQPGPPVSG